MDTTIALIISVTALCAVVLGPLVSMWAADKQARVSVLSANRQSWINSLRDALAEFVALASIVSVSEVMDLHVKIQRAFFLDAKIRLLLNPKEADNHSLIQLVNDVRVASADTMVHMTQAKEEALGESVQKLVELSQIVLKREWERVKKAQ